MTCYRTFLLTVAIVGGRDVCAEKWHVDDYYEKREIYVGRFALGNLGMPPEDPSGWDYLAWHASLSFFFVFLA